jgi:hypothetical protein
MNDDWLVNEVIRLERDNAALRSLLSLALPLLERHCPHSPLLALIAAELPSERET